MRQSLSKGCFSPVFQSVFPIVVPPSPHPPTCPQIKFRNLAFNQLQFQYQSSIFVLNFQALFSSFAVKGRSLNLASFHWGINSQTLLSLQYIQLVRNIIEPFDKKKMSTKKSGNFWKSGKLRGCLDKKCGRQIKIWATKRRRKNEILMRVSISHLGPESHHLKWFSQNLFLLRNVSQLEVTVKGLGLPV